MRKATLTSRRKSIATLLILVTLMTGCAQMNDWLTGMRTTMSKDNVILGAPGADQYIEEMYKIVNGDPATQAEIYADAESAAKLTPGPSTQLRFALVLATPGHSGSNPQQAQGVFRELLSKTELLTPSETALATIHLKAVEQLIVLGAETRRLRSAKSRAATTEEKAFARRIATVESENRRLRRSLEEAEQKLDAITTIERSLREQANTGETQN